MESSTRNKEFVRKLNTQGCCFLCLKAEAIEFCGELDVDRKAIFIGHLLRFLRIGDNLVTDTIFSTPLKFEKIQANFCESCGKIVERFSILVQQLEKVQMEMGYFMTRINQCILESAKDSCRVQAYSKRMTSDPEALSQLALVDNLRKELANKSLAKQTFPNLYVNLKRMKIPQVEIQTIKEEADDAKDEEPFHALSPSRSCTPSPPTSELVTKLKLDIDKIDNQIYPCQVDDKPTSQGQKKTKPLVQFYTKYLENGVAHFQCTKCDKKSLYPFTIERHYRSIHLAEKHKCELCNDAVFGDPAHLKRHKKSCRQMSEKRRSKILDPKFKFVCKLCGKRFAHPYSLVKHNKRGHQDVDRYPCDLCDKKFKQASHLRDHRNAIHLRKKLLCRFCQKVYAHPSSQREHEKICPKNNKIKKEPTEKLE